MDYAKLLKELEVFNKKYNPIVSFCDYQAQLKNNNVVDQSNFFYQRAIVVKDNFNFKGSNTTASSKILETYVSPYNATVIEKIRKAGGIIVAKSSLDELGMGGTNKSAYTGPVLNPFDSKRISGGSSGGSAVLVASELVDFALGSDTGDSVRKPASFCGVVGVKPTYGRISRYGVIPYASSLDHVGYFTTNVTNAAKALEVMAGRDDLDMTSLDAPVDKYSELLNSDISNLKIAILGNVVDSLNNSAINDSFNQLMSKLKTQAQAVDIIHVDQKLMRALLPVYYIIANCEATANHSNLDGLRFGLQLSGDNTTEVMCNSRTAGFSSMIRKRFVIGSYSLFEENQEKLLRKAQKVRRLISEEFTKIYQDYDVIIAPASDVAPLFDESIDNELDDKHMISDNYLVFANFLGLPSMSVPLTKINGLPVGVNITAKKLHEVEMFNVGLAVEECVNFKRWED
ncbi:MAG: amidase family protein [Erysipelotrichaceae bacterium]